MFKKITLATAVLFASAAAIHAQQQAVAADQMRMAEAAGTVAGTATVCQERSADWLLKVTHAFGTQHLELIPYFNTGVLLAYSLPATPLECGTAAVSPGLLMLDELAQKP
jgi:hypothetical protein